MLKVKEFTKHIHRVETVFALYCMVTIDDKEREISALVTEDSYYTQFDWNYGIDGISDKDLEDLEEEMLDKLYNN